jgi:hypothetical protein
MVFMGLLLRLGCIAFALTVPLSAASAPGLRPATTTTADPVTRLAADGSRVAYVTRRLRDDGRLCETLNVWNLVDGRTTRVKSNACETEPEWIVSELALAGSRLAWIERHARPLGACCSVQEKDELYAMALPGTKARLVGSAIRTRWSTDATGRGRFLGSLAGGGNVLTLNSFSSAGASDTSNERLRVIGPRGLRTIATGEGAMRVQSTDGRQIAVDRGHGTAAVYRRDGKLLRVVSPLAISVKEIAVADNRLVVLTDQNTVEVYEARSGKRLHIWPARSRGETTSSLLDACCGLAVYLDAPPTPRTAQTLHVVDLATGRNRVFAHHWNMIRDVELGPRGLVYAYDLRAGSRIVFLPLAQIQP